MALQKQPVVINFSQGLDSKTDPKQVQIGKFLALQNSVFDKAGGLVKRNGFDNITALPNTEQTTITTLNDNLIATGSNLYAYSADTDQWLNQGIVQPVDLATQSLVRSSTSQTSPDLAVAASGLACLTYIDSGTTSCYQIYDSRTGQTIVPRTTLPGDATNPRSFLLGRYFIITFMRTLGGIPHLQYIAIPTAVPTSPGTATDISAVVQSLTTGYDGYAANDYLYIGWGSTATTIRFTSLSSTLVVQAAVTITGHNAVYLSMAAEFSGTTNVVWITFQDASDNGWTAAYSGINFTSILAPTQIIATTPILELVSISQNGILNVFYENYNLFAYAPNAKSSFTSKLTVTQAGVIVGPSVLLRSVGVASKPFIDPNSDVIYILLTYGEFNQPTYFLVDNLGNIYMRLAYSNGGGFEGIQIVPTISRVDNTYYVPYVIKDLLVAVNKGTALPVGSPVNGIFTQTGINLATFTINQKTQYSSEIASALHLTGGQLWEYDGLKPVEHGFQVYPEDVSGTTATGLGAITAGTYYYVFCYEWTDNQGNLHRSAPSIPFTLVTTTSSSTNTLYVPMLRLTYKRVPNSVRIVGYRWSVAQQVYYQFTSITNPTLNATMSDYATIIDTKSDLQILGQTLLYTTGGVVENIAAPASVDSALFKNRLFLIDAEDRNLLWFSKQVLQNTPVEMSDLLTIYVAPTSGAQGSTGPMTALGAMDDKLIVFKKDAIYYITGTGPDNTGANNDYSDAVFITSSVGCANPSSVVLMPNGIMFQSDKGIWLLGRDLSTNYIGAPVEQYNDNVVMSAQTIPATNQVRFVLDNNVTLMYDYYYGQWGTFNNTFAISSTLYQGMQTYLNSYGQVFQENPTSYLDGSEPVLLSLTTGWINVAGVQGYERFYEMLLLGSYFTPFKLNVQLSYDYNPSPVQATIVIPDNYAAPWGGEAQWGSGSTWGGPGNNFEARVFPMRQKCESFQVTINEIYDPSFSVVAGQGLNLSGMNLVVGMKKGYRTNKASQSFG